MIDAAGPRILPKQIPQRPQDGPHLAPGLDCRPAIPSMRRLAPGLAAVHPATPVLHGWATAGLPRRARMGAAAIRCQQSSLGARGITHSSTCHPGV